MADSWQRFLQAREYGYPAQLAVGAYLNSRRIKVVVPPLVYHESQVDAIGYTDPGDVLDEEGRTYEVQRRTVSFAGRSTYPWPNMLTMPCEKIKQMEEQGRSIRGCFSVSADLRVAAAVGYEATRQFWFEQTVQQQTVPIMKPVFMCPLEHVKFVALPPIHRNDHRCHCGEYGPHGRGFTDETMIWFCPEHAPQ